MPANWIVRSVRPNSGILHVHLTQDLSPSGQPEEIFLNAAPETLGETFKEGDLRNALFPLLAHAGQNGPKR